MTISTRLDWLTTGLLALLLTACGGAPKSDLCMPRIGMSTDQLIACGCQPRLTGGRTEVFIDDGSGVSRRLSRTDYICLRENGHIIQVDVGNGVARGLIE